MRDAKASVPVIGIVVKRWPRLSETFVLNEILGLERAGLQLRIYALMDPHEPAAQTAISEVQAPVSYLRTGTLADLRILLVAQLALLRSAPWRYLRTLGYVLARRRHRTTFLHLFEAARLVTMLREHGVSHVHAQFAHGPTSVAHFASLLGDIPFSFTGHAKDIYLSPPDLLAVKIAAARFVATCTAHNVAYLRELAGPADHAKIHLVYHGVDTSRFCPVPSTKEWGEGTETNTVQISTHERVGTRTGASPVPTAPVRETVGYVDQADRDRPATRFRTGASPVPTERPNDLVGVDGASPVPTRSSTFSPDLSSTGAEIATPIRMIAVGRLVEKKGYSYLIRACALLHQRGCRYTLAIYGSGPQRDELAKLIDTLGLGDVVQLQGARTQEDLIALYCEADLFVLSPQILANGDRDGIPNVLMEAMSVGLPVVATSVSGIPELIEHDRSGLLVPPCDEVALAEALERLLDPLHGRALRTRLGACGRERVIERFDAALHVRRMVELLQTGDTKVALAPPALTGRYSVGAAACPCPGSLSTSSYGQGQAAAPTEDSQIPTPEGPAQQGQLQTEGVQT